jgi:spermidine synthase
VGGIVAAVSALGIAYQILLMRVLAIGQWHHFAYMVISMALLGFGASGAWLALLQRRVQGKEGRWFTAATAWIAPSMAGCYALSQRVPFETFELSTQPSQFGYLLCLYVILVVPFFVVACVVALGLMRTPESVAHTYGCTMLGSGLGALAAAGLLHLFPVHYGMLAILAAACVVGFRSFRSRSRFSYLIGIVTLLAIAGAALTPPRVSSYKGLSYALNIPGAEVVATAHSPLSNITAVRSDQIRETPGQLAGYPMSALGELPSQIGLYFDAGSISPVSQFDGALSPFAYLDYTTEAAAYRLVENPRVLVLGTGGGQAILSALTHDAASVTAVEMDPGVWRLMQGPLAAFSGNLYAHPKVTMVWAEGRSFAQRSGDTFDLIAVPPGGSMAATGAGVLALSESYLYTEDAVAHLIDRLSPNGVLAMSTWLKTPPRDGIKLFATAEAACRRVGIADSGAHLAFVRAWNHGTVVVSRAPLSAERINALRAYSSERGLDLAYLPGLSEGEANQYTALERPYYFEAAQAIVSPGRDAFLDAHPFHLAPATDDRPYFFRFFRWRSASALWRGMGTEWLPLAEWGYVTLLATLVQAAILAVVLVLAPLFGLRRRSGGDLRAGWVMVYFSTLGVAYMFLEIAFIQRFLLFLAYPVYAVAVVLTAFLVFSGLGSIAAGRWQGAPARLVACAVAAIAGLAGCYLLLLPALFNIGAAWPDAVKILVSVATLAPLAFAMGMPFPMGLRCVTDRAPGWLPWAWGINGSTSVVASVLATLVAIHLGFTAVVLIAVAVYAIGAVALVRIAPAKRGSV